MEDADRGRVARLSRRVTGHSQRENLLQVRVFFSTTKLRLVAHKQGSAQEREASGRAL